MIEIAPLDHVVVSVPVVVVFVGLEDVSCVGLSRDEDVVEEFASDGADDPFAVVFRWQDGFVVRAQIAAARDLSDRQACVTARLSCSKHG
ncbi:hypothetical protein [Amycolatopsis sp. NPDC051102]|uniref:hypothetical protein n=1 Tax=Amycolatopsis sp. NPDC051102 TaxID=3155163 RepID=UPI0034232F01